MEWVVGAEIHVFEAFPRALSVSARISQRQLLVDETGPDEETPSYMARVAADWDMIPCAVLRETPGMRKAWLRGDPLPINGLASMLNDALDRMESHTAPTGAVLP